MNNCTFHHIDLRSNLITKRTMCIFWGVYHRICMILTKTTTDMCHDCMTVQIVFFNTFLSWLGAFKAYCNETTKSWFEAQNTCLSEKQHLQQKKEAPCMNANEDYWIGQFAVDTVTWNNCKKAQVQIYLCFTQPLKTHQTYCVPFKNPKSDHWSLKKIPNFWDCWKRSINFTQFNL